MGKIKKNQYIVYNRNEKGKLVESERIVATSMPHAIEQVSGVYDVIAKI